MDIILRCASLCALGSVIALLLKKYAPELSLLFGLSVGLCAAVVCARIVREIASTGEMLTKNAALESAAVAPVLKCVGIGLVTELSKELCRDAGESTLAAFAELCGSLCALYATLPLLRSLLSVIEGLA